MASGKLSPRQKMINMMYLVLIALLALNVSKEILKSFQLFESSFEKAQDNVERSTNALMATFNKQQKNDPSLRPLYAKAEQVRSTTGSFMAYINKVKKDVEVGAGGRITEGHSAGEVKNSDDMEAHANYFMVEKYNGVEGGRGKEFEDKINDFRKNMVKLLTKGDSNSILPQGVVNQMEQSSGLFTSVPKGDKQSWVSKYFEHNPAAGSLAMIEKIKTDAKNFEAAAVKALMSNVSEEEVSFDKFVATVVAPTSYVMVGEEYKADIILTAFSSKSNHQVVLEGGSELEVLDGIASYTVRPSNVGTRKWGGNIILKTKKGDKSLPFEAEYQAFQGTATISADAMNVLYIGLENPISVSVPGANPNAVSVVMRGGSLTRTGKGSYIAKVRRGTREAIITAMVDGKVRGTMKYRIKNVPRPKAVVIPQGSGATSKASLIAQNSMRAVMDNFVFEGIRYKVTSFNMTLVPKRRPPVTRAVNGASLTSVKSVISQASKGDKVIFSDIKAKGPGGGKRLDPLVFDITR